MNSLEVKFGSIKLDKSNDTQQKNSPCYSLGKYFRYFKFGGQCSHSDSNFRSSEQIPLLEHIIGVRIFITMIKIMIKNKKFTHQCMGAWISRIRRTR